MKKHIANITITTKKNTTQTCRFLISQNTPFPRIISWNQYWENDDNVLFSSYGNDSKGIGNKFNCSLLRSDIEDEAVTGITKLEHAGFAHGDYGKEQITNLGSIVFRNVDLGEMQFCMNKAFNRDWYLSGLSVPDQIKEQIREKLSKYIDTHKKSLYREAVATLKNRIKLVVSGAKTNIKMAEEAANEALKML